MTGQLRFRSVRVFVRRALRVGAALGLVAVALPMLASAAHADPPPTYTVRCQWTTGGVSDINTCKASQFPLNHTSFPSGESDATIAGPWANNAIMYFWYQNADGSQGVYRSIKNSTQCTTSDCITNSSGFSLSAIAVAGQFPSTFLNIYAIGAGYRDTPTSGTFHITDAIGATPPGGWTAAFTAAGVTAIVDGSGPWCTSSNFVNPAASLVGGQLAVRFGWNNTTVPSGFPVTFGGSTVMTLTAANAISTQPGFYYATTSTGSTGTTSTITLPDVGLNSGCSITIPVVTNAIPTTDPGGFTPPAGESTCGVSWNILHDFECGLKYAFLPSSTTGTSISSVKTAATTHAPLSLIIGGVPFVTSIFTNVYDGAGCGSSGISGGDGALSCAGTFDGPAGTGQADVLSEAHYFMRETLPGQAIYTMLLVGVYVGGFIAVWRRIVSSFGSRVAA